MGTIRNLTAAAGLALITLLPASTAAWAADGEAQTMTFDLIVDGAVVGQREVTVRYLPAIQPAGTESRLIETYTTMDAQVGAWTAKVKNRATGHVTGTGSSFTSSSSLNGKISEVQGRTLADGRWDMHGVFDRELRRWELRRTEVDLSSIDLLDPVRSKLMTELGRARIISAETGQMMSGPIEDLGEDTLTVGDREVVVHRYAWTPAEGRFELAWSEAGLLLDWSAEVGGRRVDARIRELPPPRVYGSLIDDTVTVEPLPTFQEEEL